MNYALVLENDGKRFPSFGYCPRCKKANHSEAWCNPCDRKALFDKFNTWSTGNKALDSFIQETQRIAVNHASHMRRSYLEYVPYDRFTDVKSLARGGFAEVFTAKWLDGKREIVGKYSSNPITKGRTEPLTVALKMIEKSAKIEQSFINEVTIYYLSIFNIYVIYIDLKFIIL